MPSRKYCLMTEWLLLKTKNMHNIFIAYYLKVSREIWTYVCKENLYIHFVSIFRIQWNNRFSNFNFLLLTSFIFNLQAWMKWTRWNSQNIFLLIFIQKKIIVSEISIFYFQFHSSSICELKWNELAEILKIYFLLIFISCWTTGCPRLFGHRYVCFYSSNVEKRSDESFENM